MLARNIHLPGCGVITADEHLALRHNIRTSTAGFGTLTTTQLIVPMSELFRLIASSQLRRLDWHPLRVIPRFIDQNPSAQSRRPMDMIFHGRSTSCFHA